MGQAEIFFWREQGSCLHYDIAQRPERVWGTTSGSQGKLSDTSMQRVREEWKKKGCLNCQGGKQQRTGRGTETPADEEVRAPKMLPESLTAVTVLLN